MGDEDLAGLLDDAYQLSRAGQLSITVFLDLVTALAQRAEPLVSAWQVGSSPLVQIYQSLSMQDSEASCAARWAAFVAQNISQPAVANVAAGEPKLTTFISCRQYADQMLPCMAWQNLLRDYQVYHTLPQSCWHSAAWCQTQQRQNNGGFCLRTAL